MKNKIKKIIKNLPKNFIRGIILECTYYMFIILALGYSVYITVYRPQEDVYYNALAFVCAVLVITTYEIGQYRYETLKELLTKIESEVTEHGKQSERNKQ